MAGGPHGLEEVIGGDGGAARGERLALLRERQLGEVDDGAAVLAVTAQLAEHAQEAAPAARGRARDCALDRRTSFTESSEGSDALMQRGAVAGPHRCCAVMAA